MDMLEAYSNAEYQLDDAKEDLIYHLADDIYKVILQE